jgi:hypothetical protein
MAGAVQARAQSGADVRYPPTKSELSAHVAPARGAELYPPLNVLRYGAIGDGETDDSPAFQAAINVAKVRGGTVHVPTPEVRYLLRAPLDCTGDGQRPCAGFSIRGELDNHCGYPSSEQAIVAQHTGHIFDLSGNPAVQISDLCIGTDERIHPQTCFFMARNALGSSQIHRFNNVRVAGKFTKSVYYNYGSEDDVLDGCVFFNRSGAAGAKVVTWTANNIMELKSSFITIAKGTRSCIDHQVIGGQYNNVSADTAADVFYMDQAHYVKIFGAWAACGTGSGGGRSIVCVDAHIAVSNGATIIGLETENQGDTQNKYGVLVTNGSGASSNWTLDACHLSNAVAAIHVDPSISIVAWHIRQIDAPAHGLDLAGSVEFCTIECNALPVAIGTSRCNLLSGRADAWRVGRRDNDYWIDGRPGRAWSADVSALKVSGGLFVNRTKSIINGTLVTVSVVLQARSALTCAAGTAIGGLPYGAVEPSANVQVFNQTKGVTLGLGGVESTSILLPAIDVLSDTIVISATYFAA